MTEPVSEPEDRQINNRLGAGRYTIWLYFLITAMVLASVFAGRQQMVGHTYSVFDIDYGFGPVIRSIVQQHRFGAVDPIYGWWCYACRMPVIPLLGAASSQLSLKASVFLLLKNAICWGLWITALFRLKRRYKISDKWLLIAPLCLLLAPYNLSIAGRVDVEEGYLLALLALLFSFLLTLDTPLSALVVGVLIAVVYLTKSSTLLLCVAAVLWSIVKYRKTRQAMFLPLLGLVLATVGWGLYIHSETGVFAFGATASSWNGDNFHKGNNPYAYTSYPRVNLDSFTRQLLPPFPIHDEWELNKAQLALGKSYVQQNPGAVLRLDLRKLMVACCDLGEAPALSPGHTRPGVMFSNLVSHVVLFCVFALALVNTVRRRVSDAEVLSILLTCTLLTPYFGGFLYDRHMVPIYGLMALTLAIQLAGWPHSRKFTRPPSFAK